MCGFYSASMCASPKRPQKCETQTCEMQSSISIKHGKHIWMEEFQDDNPYVVIVLLESYMVFLSLFKSERLVTVDALKIVAKGAIP